MSVIDRVVVTAEAAWASRHISLAPEPVGDRTGVAQPPSGGDYPEQASAPVRLALVGDSLVAGCGVEDHADSLTPQVAQGLATGWQMPVAWESHGKLGATMRRVRYRLLPEVAGHLDQLVFCIGSNDIMARRSLGEWREDLAAVLDQAEQVADRVLLCSAGETYTNPWLPKRLRRAMWQATERQTAASQEVCAGRPVQYVDFSGRELPEGFWASDHFHPSAAGYAYLGQIVAEAVLEQAPPTR